MNKKILFPIIVITLILFIYIGYSVYSLRSLSVSSIDLNQIGVNTDMQLELDGTIKVYNPSLMDAEITGINYIVILDSTNETIFQGTIEGNNVPKKDFISFEFQGTSDWVPTPELASSMISAKDINITISADVNAKLLFVFDVSSTLQTKVDIAPYIQPLIKQQIQNVLSSLSSLIG